MPFKSKASASPVRMCAQRTVGFSVTLYIRVVAVYVQQDGTGLCRFIMYNTSDRRENAIIKMPNAGPFLAGSEC
jgi:hypothetical protein